MKPLAEKMQTTFRRSLWLFYAVIVLEILYMISPFALYYYSLYKVPLRFLQAHRPTSWLTVHVLPHFAYQTSPFIRFLDLLSWPLIMIGSALFLIAFGQVYWAKLRRRGPVSRGLYRYIRHPQYVALAILGLGTTLYWSRVIVCLMYATMLFLYYFLARQEERLCLEKFAEPYRRYAEQTGMFLPNAIESRLPRWPWPLPARGWRRIVAASILFACTLMLVAGSCLAMRRYAQSRLVTLTTEQRLMVAVADISRGRMAMAGRIVEQDPRTRDPRRAGAGRLELAYLIPASWGIPELGVAPGHDGNGFLSNPGGHGNPLRFDPDMLVMLLCQPVPSAYATPEKILADAVGIVPVLEIGVDLRAQRVVSFRQRQNLGPWDGIPVPIY